MKLPSPRSMSGPSRARASRLAWIVCSICACLAPLPAAEDDPANVFLRPGDQAPTPQPTASPLDTLELRGAMKLGKTTSVVLFDTATSKAFMVELNSTVNNVTAAAYDSGTSTVTVETGGRSRRIQMRKSSIVPMAMPAAPPPVMPMMGGPGQGPPTPGVAQSDEEVRQRMQRVAEEIRRRRAMRRQMLENSQQQPQQ